MLRLVGFFVVTMIVLQLLRHVPVVGRVFDVPFLGFWGAAILVSVGASRLATVAIDRRRVRTRVRELGHVDTPHNQGKLGSLLAGEGRYREALPHLERAARGEPAVAEWRYRLGCALLATRRHKEAAEELLEAAKLDEEHAYGAVLARLAQARLAGGDAAGSLDALERRERNHGPDPESAYRRGLAQRSLGHRPEAKRSFAEARNLAAAAAPFQRAQARKWAFLAFVAGLS